MHISIVTLPANLRKPREQSERSAQMPDQRKGELFPKGIWWARQDLNLGPMDYESTALTAELRARSLLRYHNIK